MVQTWLGHSEIDTRIDVYDVLNESFRTALELKLIKENPMLVVKKPKHKRIPYPAIQPREQNFLLGEIKNKKYLALFWYCVCTGLRITEAIQSFPHIDYKRCLISVQGEDTATKKHKRNIEFLPRLFTEERKALLKQITVTSAQSYFKRLFKKHEFDFVVHSFRHTFASCCHHVGIRDKWTQTKMCHTGIEMTIDTYVELFHDENTPFLDYFRELKDVYKLGEK